MNFLIINQPTQNYGDAAAHRSLIRSLQKTFPDASINTLFIEKISNENKKRLCPDYSEYTSLSGHGARFSFLMKIIFLLQYIRFPFRFLFSLLSLYPDIKTASKLAKNADYVICAPGGICMGSFQNWEHLSLLMVSKIYARKTAYYSRSWGPFPVESFWNRVFKNASVNFLKSFDFHSIRDSKTMRMADEINLKYVPSIDTVFLDQPRIKIPDEINRIIEGSSFRIVVPNSLTWHRDYKTGNSKTIKHFYLMIIKKILEKYPNDKILMLPQLYERLDGDEFYFEKICQDLNDNRLHVVSEKYDSDVQQTLISKSKLVVGARYHSIVFAINNEVPFISLSYEHKMNGLLESLGVETHSVDIYGLKKSNADIEKILSKFEQELDNPCDSRKIRNQAHNIAQNCMDLFVKEIKSTCGI